VRFLLNPLKKKDIRDITQYQISLLRGMKVYVNIVNKQFKTEII